MGEVVSCRLPVRGDVVGVDDDPLHAQLPSLYTPLNFKHAVLLLPITRQFIRTEGRSTAV